MLSAAKHLAPPAEDSSGALPPCLRGARPGQRVRVTQTIARRAGDWRQTVEGTVLALEHEKTGSWFAHGKDGKVWLWRIRLMKDDGEVALLVVDQYTEVQVLSDAPGAAAGTAP